MFVMQLNDRGLPSICRTLGSIPSNIQRQKQNNVLIFTLDQCYVHDSLQAQILFRLKPFSIVNHMPKYSIQYQNAAKCLTELNQQIYISYLQRVTLNGLLGFFLPYQITYLAPFLVMSIMLNKILKVFGITPGYLCFRFFHMQNTSWPACHSANHRNPPPIHHLLTEFKLRPQTSNLFGSSLAAFQKIKEDNKITLLSLAAGILHLSSGNTKHYGSCRLLGMEMLFVGSW